MELASLYLCRWKKARQEGGYRSEMAYCRRHFLSRTSLLTLEVSQRTATSLGPLGRGMGGSREKEGPGWCWTLSPSVLGLRGTVSMGESGWMLDSPLL